MTSLSEFRLARMKKRGADILLHEPKDEAMSLNKENIESQKEIFENFLKPMRDKLYLKHIQKGSL